MFNRRVVDVFLRTPRRVAGERRAVVLLGLLLAGCNGSLDIGNPDIDVETGDTSVDVITNVDQTQNVDINLGDSESPTAVVTVSPSTDVNRGQEVTLDASASTPGTGGGSLSFTWSEVTGFGIVIRDATTAVATAEIPLDIVDGSTIVIRVQVSAGQRADTTEARLTVVGGPFEDDDMTVVDPNEVDDTNDVCDGVSCAQGESCNPTTGLCDDDDLCAAVTCSSGETCDAATGTCEPAGLCVGVTCSAGQTCDPDTGDCLSSVAVIYVDAGVSPGGDGSSWTTAFDDLQSALAEAINSGGSLEIWVARGTYTPAEPGGDRGASFNMLNNVELLGGFAGTETTRDQRDTDVNETILSGDLDGDDLPVFGNRSDNSFHVLTANAVTETAGLDGFTIQAGNANGAVSDIHGGGILSTNGGSPIVLNCLFRDNFAIGSGGAIRARIGSVATGRIEKCVFNGNTAGGNGGAASFAFGNFIDCTFSNNHADGFAGALERGACVRCTFIGNSSAGSGGAATDDVRVTNCRFLGNTAGGNGGALRSPGRVENCEFSGNHADGTGGAIATAFGVANSTFSNNTAGVSTGGLTRGNNFVENCVFWNNTDPTGATETAQVSTSALNAIINSIVQGLSVFAGVGNISLNPQFVDALGPDGIAGTLDDDLRLMPNSPAIDAGDNALLPDDTSDVDGDGDTTETTPLDLDDTPRIKNGTVDMGAYEAG